VSQELVPVLARIDFQCVVFEERERFAAPALFPTAIRTVVGSYERIAEKIILGPEDYVVILTRGHLGDRAVLRQALRSEASYVGCIGSRKKVAATRQALMEAGIPPEDFDRVRTPIGLEIKAETPAEIAVSIAAQLILHRAQQRAV
jgi:xanthine dehydrogenase accessory factor